MTESHDDTSSDSIAKAAPQPPNQPATQRLATQITARFSSFSFRDFATTVAPAIVLVGVLLWVAYDLVDPTPPKHLVMGAGPEGSAYQAFAVKYRDFLARYGIDLEVRTTSGSINNILRLAPGTVRSVGRFGSGQKAKRAAKDEAKQQGAPAPAPEPPNTPIVPDLDVAFVQSGTTTDQAADSHGLVSLGSLFVEPVWIFYREAALTRVKPIAPTTTMPRVPAAVARAKPVKPATEDLPPVAAITQLGQLRGLKLNVGPRGSGGPRLAGQLLAANHVDLAKEITTSNDEDTSAVMKLLDGSLDAVLFVSAPDSPLVQMLLQTPGIKVFNFDQAEAYSRRLPFLTHVVLPRGIVSLEQDLPHEDIQLIAPTATLVAKESTHPAIIELLVEAASAIHGGPSPFLRAGTFPNDQYSEVPVSPVAEHFYKSGPPFLQRYLPFWLANLIERMGIILLPIAALLIPLSRVLPPLYTWRVRSRVYRWYGQLRAVENDVDHDTREGGDTSQRERQLARLNEIEDKVNQLVVPLSYADELYTLKLHIDRVRDKLGAAPSPSEPANTQPATP